MMMMEISTSATVAEYSNYIPNEDPVMEAIDCLQQQQLNALFLAREKVMALPNPNPESLRSISKSADLMYHELFSKINQLDGDTVQARIDCIVHNKIEFDSCTDAFFEKSTSDLI